MNPPILPRDRFRVAMDCLLIFLLVCLLIKPLFKAKYLDRWGSIESTFIADGRFLKDHWPHPRWQPLWYVGTRFDYVYPPALRYGTAALSRIWLPVKAYHVYTGFLYCVGIACVYLFLRVIQDSRGWAWLGAAATTLLSPVFLFLPAIRRDSELRTPIRLWVLLRYGEGPHMTALALLPLALACAYAGLHRGRPAALALAAISSALVVSHNFYGAVALAVFFPLLVWSVWVTRPDRGIWMRATAIVLLAYGLTAFWLTPSYLRVTAVNLRFVAQPGKPWCVAVTALVMAGFGLVSFRLARGKSGATYLLFIAGTLLLLSLIVLGFHWFGFRVVGEPHRLIPELDFVMILAAVEGLRRMWRGKPKARAAAAVITVVSFASAGPFVRHAWALVPLDPAFQERVEYRVQDWMARNLPDARAFTSGSIRFWYNAWHDLAQLAGGSEQGLLNPMFSHAQWAVQVGRPEMAIQWMLAMGVDAVIVPGPNSQEIYHDVRDPQKFAGLLPVLYDDHAGNVIYRVPRRFSGLARVIDRAQFDALKPFVFEEYIAPERLRAYVQAVEQGPDAPAHTEWHGSDSLDIRARLAEGQGLLVQETYDPNWRAYAAGRPLGVRKDPLGLMLIEVPPGEQHIRLVFELPLENQAGRILLALSLCAVLLLLWRGYRSA